MSTHERDYRVVPIPNIQNSICVATISLHMSIAIQKTIVMYAKSWFKVKMTLERWMACVKCWNKRDRWTGTMRQDPTECLWRAVLVTHVVNPTTFDLVISFHHLITDGMAAVVQEVLKESSRMNLVHEEEDTNNAASAVLPKPMEDVLGTVPRLSHLLMPVLKGQFPSLTGILKPPHFQGMPHDDSVSRRRNERVTWFAYPS